VGAGYKFQDGIGTLQLYAIYEVMRREHTVAAFNERSRDGYFVSATQTIGQWDVSGSWAHANASPGSLGTGIFNTYTVTRRRARLISPSTRWTRAPINTALASNITSIHS
jgi:hypothetical protein